MPWLRFTTMVKEVYMKKETTASAMLVCVCVCAFAQKEEKEKGDRCMYELMLIRMSLQREKY